jgi:hypothetical protein
MTRMAPATLINPIRARSNKVALIFVHGFSGDPAKTWGDFPKWIAAENRLADWDIFSIGYTTRLVPDIVGVWSADAPLDRLALMLYTATTLPALSRYRGLALVAHSMGGLLVQQALIDNDDLAQRSTHVVLFGTPSAGLSKAGRFAFLKRQVRDMACQSEFITKLRERWKTAFETRAPFRFRTVAGDQDEFVPSSSSLACFPRPQRAVIPGNHLEIVKPVDGNNPGVQLLIDVLAGNATAGARSAARLALESRDFVRAVSLLEPHKDDLDDQGLVELALALEQTGRQTEAIQLLEQHAGTRTDPMGVLAGRFKRRWLAEHRKSDAERAEALYQQAYELSNGASNHSQAYYHAINLAFLKLAYRNDFDGARTLATESLVHCEQARHTVWRLATQGEANLLLANTDIALDRYRQAVAQQPSLREMDSIFQQALRVADLMGDQPAFDRLSTLYRGEEAATA